MFKNAFSFDGRIRRTEYGFSSLIYVVGYLFGVTLGETHNRVAILLSLVILVVVCWFIIAQGVKRCHDLGNSGWYTFIPFYGLWLLFQPGDTGDNEYGADPKVDPLNYSTPGSPVTESES